MQELPNAERAVQALTKWLEKNGGYDVCIEWACEYSTEVRISATHTIQRGEWTQTIDAVYAVEKPIGRNPVVKHQYSTKFCETNGKQTVNWI